MIGPKPPKLRIWNTHTVKYLEHVYVRMYNVMYKRKNNANLPQIKRHDVQQ